MLSILQSKLNFTFNVTMFIQAGFEQENGSWSGAIGNM